MDIELIFQGELLPDTTRTQAVAKLAKLFNQPVPTIERRLFSGRSVRVKTVADEAAAEKFIAAFASAGAKLTSRAARAAASAASATDASATEDSATRASAGTTRAAAENLKGSIHNSPVDVNEESPVPAQGTPDHNIVIYPRRNMLRQSALAGALIVTAAMLALIWYSRPLWHSGTSDTVVASANALATADLMALGHIDIERLNELNQLLDNEPNPAPLPGLKSDVFSSLSTAGIDVAEQVDDGVIAIYGAQNQAEYAMLLLGDFDTAAIRQWLDDRYTIEKEDRAAGTIYFSWINETTCVKEPQQALHIGPTRILLGTPGRIDYLSARIAKDAAPMINVDDWVELASKQLMTVGVFQPSSVHQATDGIAAMVLAAAGKELAPASALYIGAAPVVMPPGFSVGGVMTSDDASFLDAMHNRAVAWLAKARSTATDDFPDLLDVYDRIAITRADHSFQASVRFDTEFDEELQKLMESFMQQAFSAPNVTSPIAGSKITEQLAEHPRQFEKVTPSQLKPYRTFGAGHFEPQWEGGPFALTVAALKASEPTVAEQPNEAAIADSAIAISLRGQGRALPNFGRHSQTARLKVNDVLDEDGNSLLPEQACGPHNSRQWSAFSYSGEGMHFENDKTTNFSTVGVDKELLLKRGATAREVANIRGEIEYDLVTTVEIFDVKQPLAGKTIASSGMQLRFQKGSSSTLAYQTSGDTDRLVAVRGLNAAGQVLSTSATSWGDSWLGDGATGSIDVRGEIASAQVIVARQFDRRNFAFELPGAFPSINNRGLQPPSPAAVPVPAALRDAMAQAPPAVEFEYNPPLNVTRAGPALVTVQHLQVSPFTGLYAQIGLYVSDKVPLEGQLNGAAIVVDRAILPDGATVTLGRESAVTLAAEGAYWMNGQYIRDQDRPWLKGDITVQKTDYQGRQPAEIEGRVIFRAPSGVRKITLSSEPGTTHRHDGIELAVGEWLENVLYLDLASGAERVVSVTALDSEGYPSGRGGRLEATDSGSRVKVDLNAKPESLQVLVATDTVQHEHPFSIRLQR